MRAYRPILVLAFGALLLGACSPAPVPGKITVAWKLGYGVDCSQAGIDTIRVTVQEPGERELVAETFSCSALTATISDVPAGAYTVVVEGGVGSSFEYPAFTGTVGSVLVHEGDTTDAGKVTLEKLPPQQNPGHLEIGWSFDNGQLCRPNNVETVRVTVWRELVYKEYENTLECDDGTVKIDVQPGTYAVVLAGIDAEGKVVREATKEDIEVKQGENTSLVGSNGLVLAPL